MERVVFLIRNIAPESFGGGEMYQIQLARVLKKNNYTPIIFTASEKLIEEAKKNEIEYVRSPYLKQQNWSSWRNILLPIYGAWQIKLQNWYKKQIKKYDPIVLNVQSRDELIGASLAGLKCGRKVIWTDHADFRTWSLVNVDKKLKNQIGKWILRCARKVNRIILINEHERESLEKRIQPLKLNNLVVIRNGLIDEYEECEKKKAEEDSFYFVGRVVKDKGIEELIKAFLKVKEKNQKAVLNIYGEGEDLAKYQEMAKNEKGIIFHGYLNEPLRIASSNEVFVLPSYHEGLSLALLNAAMMKKRIIATDIEGNKEVVKDGVTGLLVPVKDIDKLAMAMEKMLNDKGWAEKMAEEVRKEFEREFDFEKIFEEKMAPLYTEDEA